MDANEFLKKVQVVVIAGGAGTRLKHRTQDLPKPLLKLGDKTLLEHHLKMFTDAGCKNYVFLLGYKGEKIRDFIEEKRLVENASFQIEPKLLGRAVEIKKATKAGLINRTQPFMTTQPDDIILQKNFVRNWVTAHLAGVELGCKATVVCAEKTKYDYGALKKDERGIVTSFEENPWLEVPANTGYVCFQQETHDLIEKYVDMDVPKKLETTVIPKLVEKKQLFSYTIPYEAWIPVNDEKEFARAEKMLREHPELF